MPPWISANLSDIAQIIMGQSPDSAFYNTDGVGMPFLQGCAQFGRHFPETEIYCTAPKKVAPASSILFSVRAPVGDVNRADRDYCIGRGVAAVTPQQADGAYVENYLRFLRPEFDRIAQGSTFGAINSQDFGSIVLRLPSDRVEQARIAGVLATLDRAIEQTEALTAKSRRITKGLMQDLLTCGIDEQGHLRHRSTNRFKASLVGLIPEEWTCQTVDELLRNGTLLDVQDGNHGELHPKASDFVRQGVPFVMASDISKGEIDLERCKRITKEHCDRLRVGHSQSGDVLVSHKASIGFVALVNESDGSVMLTPQVTYYRVGRHDRLLPPFLRFLLQGQRFQSALLTLAKQSTRDYVGILLQRTISLAFPTSIDEQQAIAIILGTADARMRSLTARLNKLQMVRIGLMQDLLTGRVSVEQLVKTEADAGQS